MEGAISAAARVGYAEVLLVGPQDRFARNSASASPRGLPIEIVHASEAVTMDDKATKAFAATARLLHPRYGAAGA